MSIIYATKRIAPTGTEYRFVLRGYLGHYSYFHEITVVRVRKWYLPNETILYREMTEAGKARDFFDYLLEGFPKHPLYRE